MATNNGSYSFRLSNGRTITINDGVIDSSKAPFAIAGRGAFNWMIAINESLLQSTESFYNISAPSNPLEGQLYYKQPPNQSANVNLNDDTLQVCVQSVNDSQWRDNANKWKYIVTMYKESVDPLSTPKWIMNSHVAIGDMWYDTKNNQLNFYGSNGWVNIRDENSPMDLFKYISEDVPTATVTIVNKSIFTSSLVILPSLSFGDPNTFINDIAKSVNIDLVNDSSVGTTQWTLNKIKAFAGGINTVFLTTDTTVDQETTYNPAAPEYVAGKLLCFKNVTDNVINLTFINGNKVENASADSYRLTKRMSLTLASYYVPMLGYTWYFV